MARKSLSFLGKKRLIFFFIRFLNKPFVNNIEKKVSMKAKYLSKLIPNNLSEPAYLNISKIESAVIIKVVFFF